MKIKHLPLLSTVNLPSLESIHILTAFYPLPISLVLFSYFFIDAPEYAQVGPNYTSNFLKNGYPENFINKCFKKFMDNKHALKETPLTVENKPLIPVLPFLG